MIRTMCAAGVVALSLSTAAQAGVLYAFEETPDGVFGTLSGSLDVSEALSGGIGFASGRSFIDPSDGALLSSEPNLGVGGQPLGGPVDSYVVAGPFSFGAGAEQNATEASGDFFGVAFSDDFGDTVILPDGYISGTELSGTLGFAGETLASLGITPGTYVWELVRPLLPPPGPLALFASTDIGPNPNAITVSFTQTAVIPLPAGLPLLLAGLGAIALLRRARG